MSPFTQLNSTFSPQGGGIDRNFSPVLNFLDEFDRHFSHRHRFMDYYIPRFDLEEDAQFYYLYGEVPGVRSEDINVEAHDDHTLVISGTTHRPSPLPSPIHDYVKADTPGVYNMGNVEKDGAFAGKAAARQYQESYESTSNAIQPTFSSSEAGNPAPLKPGERQPHPISLRRTLLNERLVGNFSRTFAFPTTIVEDSTRASVENGLLCLVVPKRELTKKIGRKIPILGTWGSGGGMKVL